MAPRTNDHNCLMPNHPFHTQFYEQALFPFRAFLLSKQTVAEVEGPNLRYQIQGCTSCGIPLAVLNHLLHLQLFSSLHLSKADQENTSWRFFLLSHS